MGSAVAPRPRSLSEQEARAIAEFGRHYQIEFKDPGLLKLALTHRSYLSVTGQGPRESNERLEFLGDSVLGLVTSEYLYLQNPTEHEGQLTKTKSLLVSKAILSRRALAMGLGRFVLMSHSEVESGGRQRLSILADAFESVVGAIYLDQGFEAARAYIHRWLLKDSREIAADKRHTNYKSHLQEYVQSTYHTHPVYRIRSEMGPDHSKQFVVDVMVGKRSLGTGRGRNKKEAEQSAARDALEQVGARIDDERVTPEVPEPDVFGRGDHETVEREPREREPRERLAPREERSTERRPRPEAAPPRAPEPPAVGVDDEEGERGPRRRRGRRGGRGRRALAPESTVEPRPDAESAALEAEWEAEAGPREAEPAAPPRLHGGERDVPRRLESRVHVPRRTEERVESTPGDELEPEPPARFEDESEEIGRPEGSVEDRHLDPFAWDEPARPAMRPDAGEAEEPWPVESEAERPEAAHEDDEDFEDEAPAPARLEEDPDDADEARPGTLFSHEREAPAPPQAQPAPPVFGRRGKRRGR
ncbi:MAG TPA: ribonuclease III [Candidatus Saccharimonadaceae bacterium]|nr:ribonuclease III [Candidatus Saccharimonadaceae bacterium]